MQIIDRALMREATQTSLAVVAVFLTLFLVVGMVRYLSWAAGGDIPANAVLALLGLELLRNLNIILPLAFFIGVLMALGRWYRDNEMTVLAACGVGLWRILRPLLVVALGFVLVVGLFSFYLGPLSAAVVGKIRNQSSTQQDLGSVTPGVFNKLAGAGGAVYVEEVDRDNSTVTNVFVSSQQQGRQGVATAHSGRQYVDERSNDQFLEMRDGVRYEGVPGQADYRILEFQAYGVRLEPRVASQPARRVEAMSTLELLRARNRHDRAELQSRLSRPLMILGLLFFAVALAYVPARHARGSNVFVAILAYFAYVNLVGIGVVLIKQGRIPAELGLWWVHVPFVAVGLYFLARRAANKTLLPSWR